MGIMEALQIPSNRLDFFIRSVEIASYLPGRVRLRNSNLVGNPMLERELKAQLLSFHEIDSVETSIVTGSILIQYNPGKLRENAELRKVEEYIIAHAGRK